MASIRENHREGDDPSYSVLFRHNKAQTSRTFETERAAEDFKTRIELDGAAAALAMLEAPTSAVTLDELMDQFFEWKDARVRSDRTVADYRRDYGNWIEPYFRGHRPAGMFTELDVQQWVDWMETATKTVKRKDGTTATVKALEPKTIADKHALLSGAYKWASSRRHGQLVEYNPCAGTELPARRKKPPKGMRPLEWAAFYAAIRQISTDAADLVLFLVSSGWRWSESAALTAYSVEDYGDSMYVSMDAVIRRNKEHRDERVEDGKSEASLGRRISLDETVADMIRERMRGVKGDGLVFTTRTGRKWHYSNFRDRIWEPAVDAANLKRRPTTHWLRHTHVSWLVLSGETSLPELQRRIGHESITTTIDVYGTMIEDVKPGALAAFAKMRDGATAPALDAGPEKPAIES